MRISKILRVYQIRDSMVLRVYKIRDSKILRVCKIAVRACNFYVDVTKDKWDIRDFELLRHSKISFCHVFTWM